MKCWMKHRVNSSNMKIVLKLCWMSLKMLHEMQNQQPSVASLEHKFLWYTTHLQMYTDFLYSIVLQFFT